MQQFRILPEPRERVIGHHPRPVGQRNADRPADEPVHEDCNRHDGWRNQRNADQPVPVYLQPFQGVPDFNG